MSQTALQNIEQLEDILWAAADNLRANSKLTSSEYCMPVLGVSSCATPPIVTPPPARTFAAAGPFLVSGRSVPALAISAGDPPTCDSVTE
jgi:hypothetical protein